MGIQDTPVSAGEKDAIAVASLSRSAQAGGHSCGPLAPVLHVRLVLEGVQQGQRKEDRQKQQCGQEHDGVERVVVAEVHEIQRHQRGLHRGDAQARSPAPSRRNRTTWPRRSVTVSASSTANTAKQHPQRHDVGELRDRSGRRIAIDGV